MDDDQTGLATGALLLILGAWIMLRTFVHDQNGKNLVDRLVELGGGKSSSSSSSSNGAIIGSGDPNSPVPGVVGPGVQPLPVWPKGKSIIVRPLPLVPGVKIPDPFAFL